MSESGIAIGPILFVVAILGILAAAIAAGSGAFTDGSTQFSDKSKAAAIIEQGHILQNGWDRLAGSDIDPNTIVIDTAATTNNYDLFSPSGGGIAAPSGVLSSSPNKTWCYFTPTSSAPTSSAIALLFVSIKVCGEINRLTLGSTNIPDVSRLLDTAGSSCGSFDPDLVQQRLTTEFAATAIPHCVKGRDEDYSYQYFFVQMLWRQ